MCGAFVPLRSHVRCHHACAVAAATLTISLEHRRREDQQRSSLFFCRRTSRRERGRHSDCLCDGEGHRTFYFSRGDIILRRSTDIHDEYEIKADLLGAGGYGSVSIGTHKRTGREWAIKRIPKGSTSPTDFDVEVSALATLDHPHIIKLLEYFEDYANYYLVTELCRGPDLVDFLEQRDGKPVSEKEVSIIMRQCLKSVLGCHASGFIHRDIKLENFMITGEDRTLKMIDFGLATRYNSGMGSYLTEKVGTVDYWPPEMVIGTLRGYNTLVDEWSLGVVMYALLTNELLLPSEEDGAVQVGEDCQVMNSGVWQNGKVVAQNSDGTYAIDVRGSRKMWLGHVQPEFIRIDQRIHAAALLKDRQYVTKRLESSGALRKRSTSMAARDLLSKLLEQDPKARISAADALSHSFILEHCHDTLTGSYQQFSPGVDTNFCDKMRAFSKAPTLKKIVRLIMIHLVDETDSSNLLMKMRHTFRTVDFDGDGVITLQDLQRYLKEHGVSIPNDLAAVYASCDAYGNGKINFGEFSSAVFPESAIDTKLCTEVFRVLDREKNLVIGAQDLVTLFESKRHTLAECQEIIDEAERTIREPGGEMKGKLDFNDFHRFMRGANSPEALKAAMSRKRRHGFHFS